ncbi:MAG: hypothetical protein ABH854_05675 [Candidatus Diapherotrites archaeon]|nr:hypothetical protein [Candidatus Micrarchaeota archaeon]MBU1939619.1 hypothetical protein [Candidatus Micrarchaeota archaeon]
MGFLDKIFGSGGKGRGAGKAPEETWTMEINEALAQVSEKGKSGFAELEKQVFAHFAEIKHTLAEIKTELREFESRDLEAEEGNKRLRKIVETSKRNLIKNMSTLTERLAPPEKHDYEILRAYCTNSSKSLEDELRTFGRNVMYTGILMKQEVKNLGNYINELNSTFAKLQALFEGNSAGRAMAAKAGLEGLKTGIAEREKISAEIKKINTALMALREDEKKKASVLAELQNSAGIKELNSLMEKKAGQAREKQELKGRFINLIAPIDRPLNRFMRLAESGNYVLEDTERALLNAYLTNPFLAAKQDPKAEILKKLLADVEQMVRNGIISLKEKERAKKMRALAELKDYDFFGELFWKLNKIDAEIAATEREIESSKISAEISGIERGLNAISNEVEENTALLKNAEQRLGEASRKIGGVKADAEKLLKELSFGNIVLKMQEPEKDGAVTNSAAHGQP